MKTANINYIHFLYYPLISMTDAELSEFEINNKEHRSELFRLMKETSNGFGPKTMENISNCLEHIIYTQSYEKHWRDLVPHEIPLDDVKNKDEFINQLFLALFQRTPSPTDIDNICISRLVPLQGLNIKD
ncbi:Uncharacterised protein [Pseudomonas putida]|uniref:Uncharacterized protein n=1 Tax=Pseudomonas putida NBRC 14164 TaxID=1211579 RepID=A0ABN5UKN9_PSEPU|nr:hypothetical protein PP4_23050 [Pseudomonas putida NBRC 14164]GLO24892.1 hypothetical protein PPUJ21368_27200 [Pseudomonas putida]SUD71055.1 Uncharacterised protein [Pseudomonas putida]